jgi:hypothetical protein
VLHDLIAAIRPDVVITSDYPNVATAGLQKSPVSYAAKLTAGLVSVVDANSLICAPLVCAPVVGNVLVYSDRHHLTWPYSKSTAPFLERLLLKANSVLAGGTR